MLCHGCALPSSSRYYYHRRRNEAPPLTLMSHLFFLFMYAFSVRLIRYTVGLAVMSCSVFSRSVSFRFHSPNLMRSHLAQLLLAASQGSNAHVSCRACPSRQQQGPTQLFSLIWPLAFLQHAALVHGKPDNQVTLE